MFFFETRRILYNLFYFTLILNYTSDNMLRTVFMPQFSAVDLVNHLFDVYVGYGCILLFLCCFFSFLFCFVRINVFINVARGRGEQAP